MIERGNPEWHPIDVVKSIRDIARVALNRFADHIDTRYANQLNSSEDES